MRIARPLGSISNSADTSYLRTCKDGVVVVVIPNLGTSPSFRWFEIISMKGRISSSPLIHFPIPLGNVIKVTKTLIKCQLKRRRSHFRHGNGRIYRWKIAFFIRYTDQGANLRPHHQRCDHWHYPRQGDFTSQCNAHGRICYGFWNPFTFTFFLHVLAFFCDYWCWLLLFFKCHYNAMFYCDWCCGVIIVQHTVQHNIYRVLYSSLSCIITVVTARAPEFFSHGVQTIYYRDCVWLIMMPKRAKMTMSNSTCSPAYY